MGHVPTRTIRQSRPGGHVERCEHRRVGERLKSSQGDGRLRLGRAGEDAAARAYVGAGYAILERNRRIGRGEIDIIAARDRTLVFCEVKTRSGLNYGLPSEAVGKAKQSRLRRLAAEWMSADGRSWDEVRFDVASVEAVAGRVVDVQLIEAAF